MLADLHTHLYGCLQPDDLAWLASRKPPRWHIFSESYERTYGRRPDIEGLFQNSPASEQLLRKYYHFKKPGDFQAFQTSFDLVIALAHTDPDELQEIATRVLSKDVSDFVEYRMLLPLRDDLSLFREKIQSLCEGFAQAEKQSSGKTARLALSISREAGQREGQYEVVRDLMSADEIVRHYVTGIDFCFIEEGHPPREKKEFFGRVISDNLKNPDEALAILYHVGESFTDKSVESAARWVLESARFGAHRLGHAVAAGVPPERYLNTSRSESVSERLDQLEFEEQNVTALEAFDYRIDLDELGKERRELKARDPGSTIALSYDEERVRSLGAFQNFVLDELRKTSAVVESCPTSNLRIAGLIEERFHPLPRFIAAGLPVILGSDDPGILDTDIQKEFEIISRWPGVSQEAINQMRRTAIQSRSELLAGRPFLASE